MIVYAKNNSNLEHVSSSGGTPAPVTTLGPGETAHRWPQFLPDGRRFLYVRASGSREQAGVYVGSLDAKPDSQTAQPLLVTNRQAWWVTSEHSGNTYLLMQRDASLLAQPFDTNTATLSGTPVPVASGVGAFALATSGLWSVARNGALVYRGGDTGLPRPTWVDLTGRTVGSFGEPGYANLALSPDGKRVAFVLVDAQGSGDVWVKDVAGGANTRLTVHAGAELDDEARTVIAGPKRVRFTDFRPRALQKRRIQPVIPMSMQQPIVSASRTGAFKRMRQVRMPPEKIKPCLLIPRTLASNCPPGSEQHALKAMNVIG